MIWCASEVRAFQLEPFTDLRHEAARKSSYDDMGHDSQSFESSGVKTLMAL